MKAWLCLGSNQEKPFRQLEKAIRYLKEKCYITILKEGKAIKTKPFGYTDQPDFVNQLLHIETPLSAEELLIFLKKAELELGRFPTFKWGPRTIDLDILFYENEVINRENLVIPHPGIAEREYLLQLLWEEIPDYVHPVLQKTIRELNEKLTKEKS
ncbi:MAG: 2-amino-4-hydroxy-6-hydroxymethyldihydropteridine diphosphokinase [Candidatus Cloacimonadaceae bacterium]